MAKDIGMTIHKGIVAYLVWLLFGNSIPIGAFIFLNVVSVVFRGEEKGMNGVLMVWLCGVDEQY